MKQGKQEYVIIIQGDMTPFQRSQIAKIMEKKAIQIKGGFAVNAGGNGYELTLEEMMNPDQHPSWMLKEVEECRITKEE